MKLQVVVSDSTTADQVVDALTGLGHQARATTEVPGLVVVSGLAPADAPVVQRIASMMDHPARRPVPA